MGEDRDGGSSSPEDAIDALSHPVRRHVVKFLLEKASHGQEVGMSLLVNEIARFKAQDLAVSPEDCHLGTVRTELEDTHLPRLEQAGLLTVDTADDRVTLTESATTIRSYLAGLDD